MKGYKTQTVHTDASTLDPSITCGPGQYDLYQGHRNHAFVPLEVH